MVDVPSPICPRRPVAASPRAPSPSGLTVPDFAACLQMGLQPVGFVQGYCVMQWPVVRHGLALHPKYVTVRGQPVPKDGVTRRAG